jgi:hypothetical protein
MDRNDKDHPLYDKLSLMKKHLHDFGDFYLKHRKVFFAMKAILFAGILAWVFILQIKDGMFFHGSAPTYAQLAFDCSTVTDITGTECDSLVAFYNATDGDHRYIKTNR